MHGTVNFRELPKYLRDQIRGEEAKAKGTSEAPRRKAPFYGPDLVTYYDTHREEFEKTQTRRSPRMTMLTKLIGVILLAYVAVGFAYACWGN